MMKKCLFALLFVALAGPVLADGDSYLYWMVADNTGYTYDSVKVHAIYTGTEATGSDKYLSLYQIGDVSESINVTYSDVTAASEAGRGFYASLAGAMDSNYSYVIELFNNSKFVAQSFPDLTYASAADYIATTAGGASITPTLWMPTSYNVPEPNSALLLLLGCAGLALRRRRLMHA